MAMCYLYGYYILRMDRSSKELNMSKEILELEMLERDMLLFHINSSDLLLPLYLSHKCMSLC